MARLLERVRRAVGNYGVGGTVVVIWKNLASRLRRFTPAGRKHMRREADFDQELGVDTTGTISLAELDIDSANAEQGHRYQPTPVDVFTSVFEELDLPYSEFSFVDIGSGKGRTLLLAAGFGFKRVIGVEFAPELHEVALRNIAAFRVRHPDANAIESVCADATRYELPREPLVLYFYHPFEQDVFRPVVESIRRSWLEQPRPLWVVYLNPILRRLFDQADFLELQAERDSWCVYRART